MSSVQNMNMYIHARTSIQNSYAFNIFYLITHMVQSQKAIIARNDLMQVGEGRKTLRFFKDGTENNHNIPFSEKPKNLARHMEYNPRHQAGVKMQYVKSVKARGIVESVRGECWAIAPAENDGRPAPYLLLSCASLVEAYYTAIAEEPNNENLIATAKKGMEARVLSIRTPASVCRYLTTLHNQFHHGASTNFLELIRIAPQVHSVGRYEKHIIILIAVLYRCVRVFVSATDS